MSQMGIVHCMSLMVAIVGWSGMSYPLTGYMRMIRLEKDVGYWLIRLISRLLYQDFIAISHNTHPGGLSAPGSGTAAPWWGAPLQHRDKITKCNTETEHGSRANKVKDRIDLGLNKHKRPNTQFIQMFARRHVGSNLFSSTWSNILILNS